MPFTMTTDQEAGLAKLQKLRRANQEAIREIQAKPGTAAEKMVTAVTAAFAEKWEATAPRLTGALASSTRGEVTAGVGLVFIDQTAVNPIGGGKPSRYGPVVHRRRPWVTRLVRAGVKALVRPEAEAFVDDLEDIYK